MSRPALRQATLIAVWLAYLSGVAWAQTLNVSYVFRGLTQFNISSNSVAQAGGIPPFDCTTLNFTQATESVYYQAMFGVCKNSWIFGPTRDGPHFVSKVCSGDPSTTSTYTVTVISGNAWVFNETDTLGFGRIFTFTPGCSLASALSFVGVWRNDDGTVCYNISAGPSMNTLRVPMAALFGPTVGGNTQCVMTTSFSVANYLYNVTCNGQTYAGTLFLNVFGHGPSSTSNGGAGSSFLIQQNRGNTTVRATSSTVLVRFFFCSRFFVFHFYTRSIMSCNGRISRTMCFASFHSLILFYVHSQTLHGILRIITFLSNLALCIGLFIMSHVSRAPDAPQDASVSVSSAYSSAAFPITTPTLFILNLELGCPCPRGQYGSGSGNCTNCVSGTYMALPLSLSTNASICTAAVCPPAYTCSSIFIAPTICPSGSFCPSSGSVQSVIVCPAGMRV
jgi:hypothetical protein